MKIALLAATALLALPAAAQASEANALQPANVYFGQVKSGTHPTAIVTVKNVTKHRQWLRRFDLAGAGGRKFTLTWRDTTCGIIRLNPGQTCTLRVRVATTKPEFWQTTLSVYYGLPSKYAHGTRGQFNGSVYAHVVA